MTVCFMQWNKGGGCGAKGGYGCTRLYSGRECAAKVVKP